MPAENDLDQWTDEISNDLAKGNFGKVKNMIETIYDTDPTAFYELYEKLMCEARTRDLLVKGSILKEITNHLPTSIKRKFFQVKQYLDQDSLTYHSRIETLLTQEKTLETYAEIVVWLSSLLEKHVLKDALYILSRLTGASKNALRREVERSNILAIGLLFLFLGQHRISLTRETRNRLKDVFEIRNRRIHHKYVRVEKMRCYQLLESFSDIVVKWQDLKSSIQSTE